MRRLLPSIVFIFLSPALANAQNQPPVANAGPDRNAYTGVWTTLQRSATDPENDPIIGWAWEIVQTPPGGGARLLSQDEQNLQFLGYVEGDYVMSPTVWDGMTPFVGFDYATVQVRDNAAPIAVATADRTTIHVGDTVCFDGSQSHDPEVLGSPSTCGISAISARRSSGFRLAMYSNEMGASVQRSMCMMSATSPATTSS